MYAAALVIAALVLISVIVGCGNSISSSPAAKTPSAPPRDVAALAAHLPAPALRLVSSEEPANSFLGGRPSLPAGLAWPQKNGRPLTLLAKLELQEIQAAMPIEWLPAAGTLLFFYDVEDQPWGFDANDRGGWSVVLLPPNSPAVEPTIPAAPALSRLNMRFEKISSLPSSERDEVQALQLTDEEFEAYDELLNAPFGDSPRHQIAGFPVVIQNDDMQRECQLACSGLNLDIRGVDKDKKAKAKALEVGAAEWRLLLQFDTDDRLKLMWGDSGTLYFWVRESEARKGDFSNAWLVLQCY